jgi:predicted alpha/beta-fold hydrolase
MRSCGGTEHLSPTNYHAGQTGDLLHVLKEMRRESRLPFYLVGFSLGGNVSLKLAGELGENAPELLAGVCAVSTPIDLRKCVEALAKKENFIYEWRFVSRLKQRIVCRHRQHPDLYPLEPLKKIRTVYEFDDRYTARMFGFGNAENYYGTQSAKNFLEAIRIPTLLVQAKDDPLIPFEVFEHPAFQRNPNLKLVAADHGGHLGFIASRRPRFWVDTVVLHWLEEVGNPRPISSVSP